MSTTKYVSSTPFLLTADLGGDHRDRHEKTAARIRELIQQEMYTYRIDLEPEDSGSGLYRLTMEVGEVGASFEGRVQRLLNAMMNEGCVASPAQVTIRSDEMNDERDSLFYIGPCEAAINHFKEEMALEEIAQLMGVKRNDPVMTPIARHMHKKSYEEFIALNAQDHSCDGIGADGRSLLDNVKSAAVALALRDSGWAMNPTHGALQIPSMTTAMLVVDEKGGFELRGATDPCQLVIVDQSWRGGNGFDESQDDSQGDRGEGDEPGEEDRCTILKTEGVDLLNAQSVAMAVYLAATQGEAEKASYSRPKG
jgi:hypothetical protein